MANPKDLEAMHATNGVGPAGRTCGECANCVDKRRPHRTLGSVCNYVCLRAATRITGRGQVSRKAWAKRWSACGLFQASEA